MNKSKVFLMAMGVVLILTVIFLENPVTVGAAEKCSVVTICGREILNPSC